MPCHHLDRICRRLILCRIAVRHHIDQKPTRAHSSTHTHLYIARLHILNSPTPSIRPSIPPCVYSTAVYVSNKSKHNIPPILFGLIHLVSVCTLRQKYAQRHPHGVCENSPCLSLFQCQNAACGVSTQHSSSWTCLNPRQSALAHCVTMACKTHTFYMWSSRFLFW